MATNIDNAQKEPRGIDVGCPSDRHIVQFPGLQSLEVQMSLQRTGALLVSSLFFSCIAAAQDEQPEPSAHVPDDVELDEQTGALRIGDVQLADAYAAVEALQLVDASVEVAVRERVQRNGRAHRRVLEVTIQTRSADQQTADSAVLTFDATSLDPVMPAAVEEEEAGETPLYWLESTPSRRRGPPAHAQNEQGSLNRRNANPHALPIYWASQHVGPIYWSSENAAADTPLYWLNATEQEHSVQRPIALPMLPYDRAAE